MNVLREYEGDRVTAMLVCVPVGCGSGECGV